MLLHRAETTACNMLIMVKALRKLETVKTSFFFTCAAANSDLACRSLLFTLYNMHALEKIQSSQCDVLLKIVILVIAFQPFRTQCAYARRQANLRFLIQSMDAGLIILCSCWMHGRHPRPFVTGSSQEIQKQLLFAVTLTGTTHHYINPPPRRLSVVRSDRI